MLDRHAPGGQAGSSSRIENYLGFPTGVSGTDLTRRALTQAQRLGAELLVPLEVTGVSIEDGYKHLTLSDGREIVTRTTRRRNRHDVSRPSLPWGCRVCGRRGLLRRGDHRSACVSRPARLRRWRRKLGGQAAMHLARYARTYTSSSAATRLRTAMSQYLIDQIERRRNPAARATEVARVEGDGHVERVALTRSRRRARREDVDAVFVFIGTGREANGYRRASCAMPRGSC